jgi:hypothetical protein
MIELLLPKELKQIDSSLNRGIGLFEMAGRYKRSATAFRSEGVSRSCDPACSWLYRPVEVNIRPTSMTKHYGSCLMAYGLAFTFYRLINRNATVDIRWLKVNKVVNLLRF